MQYSRLVSIALLMLGTIMIMADLWLYYPRYNQGECIISQRMAAPLLLEGTTRVYCVYFVDPHGIVLDNVAATAGDSQELNPWSVYDCVRDQGVRSCLEWTDSDEDLLRIDTESEFKHKIYNIILFIGTSLLNTALCIVLFVHLVE
jgi:hypothetical protein